MRVMALDIGERRIGVALSDPTAFLARPFGTLPGGGGARSLAKRLRPIIAEEDVGQLVVGLPLRMSGERGPEALSIEKLVADLKRMLDIPIVLSDERLTTVEATRHMIESGTRRSKRRQNVDRVAAAVILQAYLDHERGSETMQTATRPAVGDADGDR